MLIYYRFMGSLSTHAALPQGLARDAGGYYDLIGLDNERSEWPLFTFPETISAPMAHLK